MELLSLVLSLRPLKQPENPAEFPRWWGRAAHALLLNTLRKRNDILAAELHESPSGENLVRPFTVSTLMGHFKRGLLIEEELYMLRLTAFREDVAEVLWAEAAGGSLSPGSTVEMDFIPFEVRAIHADRSENIWAAKTTFAELSAPYLLAKTPASRRISLQWTSPVTFKSGGRHVPLPLPELVFGSLLERWNAHAPVIFPPETKRYAAECLALSRYHLQTRSVPQKSGGLRMGAVGNVTFASLNYDRYWMSVLSALAEFSLFSGLGAGTTAGLGQCRRVDEGIPAADVLSDRNPVP